MPGMSLFAAALLALGLSAWLTHLFCRPSSRFYMPDKPNRRSLHKRPKPRSGGIAILAGLLAGGMVVFSFIVLLGLYLSGGKSWRMTR